MNTLQQQRRRRPHVAFAVAIVLTLVAALALAPSARAGRYTVAQCDRTNRAFPDAVFERQYGGDYGIAFRCEEDENGNSLQVHAITGAPDNRFGRISWAAPSGARIVGVDAEARLRNDAGNLARLSFLDGAGNEVGRIATGNDSAGSFESYSRHLTDSGRERFAASLGCVERNGCRYSEQARAWIRSVRLTIQDTTPPSVAESGSLLSGAWQRGTATLYTSAADAGAGVQGLYAAVNGASISPTVLPGCATIAGTGYVSRTQPCPPVALGAASLDTAAAPFANGDNQVLICAFDFGGFATPACHHADVKVDNAAPQLAFSSHQDPDDPELLSASILDLHSGASGGGISYRPYEGGAWRELPTQLVGDHLQARVDSFSEPAGRYVFRAVGNDVAGNQGSTSLREDGSEMVLTFPLRSATSVEASMDGDRKARLRYGSEPELEATLRDAAGNPIAGQPLEVVETYAPGASLGQRGRTVTTDARGRIAVKLPAGPSRDVSVVYAGSRRYLAAAPSTVGLTVDGYARLGAIPRRVTAGRKVLFRGSVGTLGATLARGKLVELQVKGGGIRRFRTVRQAFRTDPRGRWSLRYGFDRFYERPTRFRFRLKVSREGGWPYLAPSVSRSRTLQVMPRRR